MFYKLSVCAVRKLLLNISYYELLNLYWLWTLCPGWSVPGVSLQVSNNLPIMESICFATTHLFFLLSQHCGLLKDLGLHFMCLEYDHLSLVICASSEFWIDFSIYFLDSEFFTIPKFKSIMTLSILSVYSQLF